MKLKKRILALLMAATMIIGCSMTVCADDLNAFQQLQLEATAKSKAIKATGRNKISTTYGVITCNTVYMRGVIEMTPVPSQVAWNHDKEVMAALLFNPNDGGGNNTAMQMFKEAGLNVKSVNFATYFNMNYAYPLAPEGCEMTFGGYKADKSYVALNYVNASSSWEVVQMGNNNGTIHGTMHGTGSAFCVYEVTY